MEIIAGFWAVFIIIPMDSVLYKFFTGTPSYPITTMYWIFFGFYTTFFIMSGALIPVIKWRRMIKTLNKLVLKKRITIEQKKRIAHTLSKISIYKPLSSQEGCLNFILENIFSISVMFAWFGLEDMVTGIMAGKTLVVATIYMILFFALLILQSFLDDYITHQVRVKYKNNSVNNLCSISRILTMQIVADVGGGGSSDKMGQLLLEQTIDKIENIIKLSNSKKNIKQKKYV